MSALKRLLLNPFGIVIVGLVLALGSMFISMRYGSSPYLTLLIGSTLALTAAMVGLVQHRSEDTKEQAAAGKSLSEEQARVLTDRLNAAYRKLDAVSRKPGAGIRPRSLVERPWVLILGEPGSGRHSAMQACRQTRLERADCVSQSGQPIVSFFLTDQALFILDRTGSVAPGAAGAPVEAMAREQSQHEWKLVLHWMKRRRKQPIDSAVLVVPVVGFWSKYEWFLHATKPSSQMPRHVRADGLYREEDHNREEDPNRRAERLQHEAESKLAQDCRKRIDQVREILDSRFEVNILLTKSDFIDGFVPMLSGLNDAHRAEKFGFELGRVASSSEDLFEPVKRRMRTLAERLSERVSLRLIQADAPAAAETVWTFVLEMLRHDERVARFITAFTNVARGDEPPNLVGVYFGSALQERTTAPGVRVTLVTDAQNVLLSSGVQPTSHSSSYFLPGMWQRVVDRAKLMARPDASRHRIALALGAIAALIGAGALGMIIVPRYKWLEELKTAVTDLQRVQLETNRSPRNTPNAEEIQGQETLLNKLCNNATSTADCEKAAPKKDAWNEDVHKAASDLLTYRIGCSLVRPLRLHYDVHAGAGIQTWLNRGKEWSTANESVKDQYFLDGYNGLKLLTLLDGSYRKTARCPAANSDDIAWLYQSLLRLWGNVEHRHRLERSLSFFSAHYVRGGLSQAISSEELQAEATRTQLASGKTPDALLTRLLISDMALGARQLQLQGQALTDAKGGGISEAYTTPGCQRLFSDSQRWKSSSRWVGCVLDQGSLSANPKELESLGRKNYPQDAAVNWSSWLKTLARRDDRSIERDKENPEKPLEAAKILLLGIAADLKQLFSIIGAGQSLQAGSAKLDPACQDALHSFTMFRRIPNESAEPNKAVLENLEKYIKATTKLAGSLDVLTRDNLESMAEVVTAYNTLAELKELQDKSLGVFAGQPKLDEAKPAPAKLKAAKPGATSKPDEVKPAEPQKLDAAKPMESQLFQEGFTRLTKELTTARQSIGEVLTDKANKVLNKIWAKNISGDWGRIKYPQVDEKNKSVEQPQSAPQRCDAVQKFLNDKLASFRKENLEAFYDPPSSCTFKIRDAAQSALSAPISHDTCSALGKVLDSSVRTCPGATAATTPQPVQQQEKGCAELAAVPVNKPPCNVLKIRVDTGRQLCLCGLSNYGQCSLVGSTMGQPMVSILPTGDEESWLPIAFDKNNFHALIVSGTPKTILLDKELRRAMQFERDVRETPCGGVIVNLFVDRFLPPPLEQAPKNAPHDWWQSIRLPAKLL